MGRMTRSIAARAEDTHRADQDLPRLSLNTGHMAGFMMRLGTDMNRMIASIDPKPGPMGGILGDGAGAIKLRPVRYLRHHRISLLRATSAVGY
jgi:hypothetical protein